MGRCLAFIFGRYMSQENCTFDRRNGLLLLTKERFMAKVRGTIEVDVQRCKGCNLCVVACPTKVLELHPTEVNDKSYHYTRLKNLDDCIGCASCGMVCPDGVITVYKVKLP